jgi:hypothetical protein
MPGPNELGPGGRLLLVAGDTTVARPAGPVFYRTVPFLTTRRYDRNRPMGARNLGTRPWRRPL